MKGDLRKFALAIHLTVSTGWIGAVLAYLAMSLAAQTSRDDLIVRAAWIVMDLTGWYVLVPLAFGSVATGLVMSLGTDWGLFRHYWVLFSFGLTVSAAVILVLHMVEVSALADVARGGENAALDIAGTHLPSQLRQGDLLHPLMGLVVLLIVQVLNVYKPRGLTRYGWRKDQEKRAAPQR
ncbi:MAG TPA: DUF2269 domain-containing protein [Actinomycetota bacterium]|nr:DUF2269 domain-containing protein [Actinomycetota bacterium]